MRMSAATMSSVPAIPPRPAKTGENDSTASGPVIPPRPTRRFNRSVSPNPDRFAPSPLNEGAFASKSPDPHRLSATRLGHELERSTSVEMPSVGEEGREYAVAIEELGAALEAPRRSSGSPEQTRTVGEDLKLHAPKPTMPAQSAKQRVAAVTRTDSERAAAFGIGRPSHEDQTQAGMTLRKKPSTASQLSHQSDSYIEDEHGIPEIGRRVPMLANAGDVQAPSPDPAKAARHHARAASRGGFGDLPSDVYGLHGHGVTSTDKLDKAYYEKHPEILQKERYNPLHGRVRDYAMSSEDLNKIVRDTASRGAGFGDYAEYIGTPSEQVGFQAAEEYASRIASPRPPSSSPKQGTISLTSGSSATEVAADNANVLGDDDVIHVDEPSRRTGSVKFGDETGAEGERTEEVYAQPILASDEVAKDTSPYQLQPAIEPPPDRHGSVYDMEEPGSRSASRPTSIYSPPLPEIRSTPLEDVEEYEPLFPEDDKSSKKPPAQTDKTQEPRQRFPSRDIWEDPPNSVYSTAEVSTPEILEARQREQAHVADVPPRDGETPAQAFARRQEELAEKEAITPDSFLHRQQKAASRVENQSHLAKGAASRPGLARRFPSRDVWEDTPDSLQFTTTVSAPQTAEEPHEEEVAKPATEEATQKPAVSVGLKKQEPGEESAPRPVIPSRPKPQIPARPSRPSSEPKEPEPVAKQKPAVPARPAGGKIAALQAGFLSDLNNRLRLGPQAPKKEEDKPQEQVEEKETAPLSDARKGRARGPQRRAPAKVVSSSVAAETGPTSAANDKPLLTFSLTRTLWSIDEEGNVQVDVSEPEKLPSTAETKPEEIKSAEPKPEKSKSEEPNLEAPRLEQKKVEAEAERAPEVKAADAKPKETAEEDNAVEVTKTLATNTAGEPILKETIKEEPSGDQVLEVEDVKDEVEE
ncbi:altered inheritance of mitochondria protein 21 [Durotheca rogersii]|uniref:altered inheritance of mitochondria protein 21 n=1 Tax=Durotheca rogersii TaxID=419775 RepID=UPI002220FF2C|nr:altered inheritance of mitochondria protein 21 [Durotheca rogersii]KAI5866368.1 altered inheritance of mitochondria protein 21 [Durotheca rogersii]